MDTKKLKAGSVSEKDKRDKQRGKKIDRQRGRKMDREKDRQKDKEIEKEIVQKGQKKQVRTIREIDRGKLERWTQKDSQREMKYK